jgi:hypothetical protein
MKAYNFTQTQLERIYEMLESLNGMNTNPLSNQKISGIAMYTDTSDNFVCTYVLRTFGNSDGAEYDIKYVMIKPNGTKIDLLSIYRNETEVIEKVNKMKEITL